MSLRTIVLLHSRKQREAGLKSQRAYDLSTHGCRATGALITGRRIGGCLVQVVRECVRDRGRGQAWRIYNDRARARCMGRANKGKDRVRYV